MSPKSLALSIFTAGLLLTGTVFAAPDVDEIVAKAIEARGGYDAIKALDSARISGEMNMMGNPAPMRMEWKRPNKMRMEFDFQGMTAVMAYDGEGGWSIMPFLGKTTAEPMAEDQLKDVKNQADFDGELVDYKAKGHQVELVGKEEVDGTDAWHLKLTKASGDIEHIYLDAEHYLAFKQTSNTTRQGVTTTINTLFGDYQEVAGVLFPFYAEAMPEGAPAGQAITILGIEPNVEIDDARFAMPETTAVK